MSSEANRSLVLAYYRRVVGDGHLGEWLGIKPTGKRIQLRGINLDRVQAGRIVEHWGEADTIGMLMQMGLNPLKQVAAI